MSSTVRREIVLPVERERAWELLTEPGELREWLADDVELEPEEGAPLRVAWATGEAREGVVEEVEEQRRLRFRWDDDATGVPSRVEWTLDDAPGGTRVVVEERPLVPLELRGVPIALAPARDRHHGAGARRRARVRVGMDVDAVFAALADPTRRAVIGRLAQEPASASRLAGELPVSRQAVAKHLAALDRAGLVGGAPRGPRDALRARPGADGRGDGVDGLRRRAVGRAARAAGASGRRAVERPCS